MGKNDHYLISQSRWNVGFWIVRTTCCTHFKSAVYFVTNIVMQYITNKQSENKVILT